MGMVVSQYEVFLIELDPTRGYEMQKTRPCLVLSPNEMNNNIGTVIIAPMTTKSPAYPSRVEVTLGGKTGWVVLDQIRTVDKSRLIKKLGKINEEEMLRVKSTIKEMPVD